MSYDCFHDCHPTQDNDQCHDQGPLLITPYVFLDIRKGIIRARRDEDHPDDDQRAQSYTSILSKG